MPLKPWQEQMLRATYKPEDIDAALEEDPNALEWLWAETGRQLRDEDEHARLAFCLVCHRAATAGRCTDCHAVASLITTLSRPAVYVAGAYEYTPAHSSGGAGLVLVDAGRPVATAALHLRSLSLRSRRADEKVVELGTQWAPGVPIVSGEATMVSRARYEGIDVRLAEGDEAPEVRARVHALAAAGARGVMSVQIL